MENQRHSLLRLNGRPPEHGFKATCANVEITSADVHTTDDVQTFFVDAKLMRSQASAGGINSANPPQNWRPIFGRWQKKQHNSPYLQKQKTHQKNCQMNHRTKEELARMTKMTNENVSLQPFKTE